MALSGVCAFACSLYGLLGHGETGGDSKILIVSGVLQESIGGSVFSRLKDGRQLLFGFGEVAGLKVSSGLASGGDIRLRMGGNWAMLLMGVKD